MQVIDFFRHIMRVNMRVVARSLHRLSGGHIHPDAVTIFGFLAHIPIALLIATGHYFWAAVLLIFFGLFDTLDGELARLQDRASARGMLMDATSDRIKEVFLYTGVAHTLAMSSHPLTAVWATAACGTSICVSYIKAKGEAAIAAGKPVAHAVLNRLFKDGLFTFEVRMVALIVGLLVHQLVIATALIAILAAGTALQRYVIISRQL